MHTPFDAGTAKFDVATQVRRGLVLGVSHAPPQGVKSQRSPIFRVLSIYAYTLYRITTKFDVVTHVGEGCILGVIHAFHHKTVDF